MDTNKKKIIYIYIQIAIILTLISFMFFTGLGFSNIYYWNLIAILLTIWSVYTSVSIIGSIINIYSIFFMFCYLFNFGQVIIYCFDLTDNIYINRVFQIYSEESIIKSVVFVTFCLAFTHLGALVFIRKESKVKKNFSEFKLRKCWSTGVILFMIAILPSIVFDGSYMISNLKYGYLSIFSLSVNNGLWDDLSRLLKPAIILLMVGNLMNPKKFNFWFYFAMVYSILKIFLIGQRGYEIAFIIAIIWLKMSYHNFKVRKIDLFKYAVLGFFLLKSMFVISEIRGMSLKYLTLDVLIDKFSDNSFVINQISELGASLGSICGLFERVPLYIPYGYGMSYLKSLLLFLPNLNFLGSDIYYGYNPFVLLGEYYDALGGSLYGELFYNFGYLGSIISILLGVFLSNLSNKSNNKSPLVIVICGLLLYMMLWIIRDSFSYIPRFILFNVIFVILIYKYIRPIKIK